MGWMIGEKFRSFINNRWLVFVAAMWVQSCAGIGYLFGSISPVIKTSLNYNQKQIARLGIAKDLGDSVGFLAGTLCEILPLWVALFVGALQNFVGYGWVWLIITGRAPPLPLWAVKLAEVCGKDFVSVAFFKLALESKAEPIENLRDELKQYLLRNERLCSEDQWKDVSSMYGL